MVPKPHGHGRPTGAAICSGGANVTPWFRHQALRMWGT